MRRGAIVSLIAIACMALYPWVYRDLFGLGAVYLLSPRLLHMALDLGGHAVLVSLHFAVSLLLTLVLLIPIAILIAFVFRRWWWAAATLFGIWLVAPDVVAFPEVWGRHVEDHAIVVRVWALGLADVFAVALGLTYLTHRLISNSRWSRP